MVTETYPPEVNGVAMTLAQVVEGLHRRNHDVQLIRPRQAGDDAARTRRARFHEVLMRGLPIPRYPHLRMGAAVPSARWCALWRAAAARRGAHRHRRAAGLVGAAGGAAPASCRSRSDFRTNFHAYSRHYGIGWLQQARSWPTCASSITAPHCTMVPTEPLRRELAAQRLPQRWRWWRAASTRGASTPARRSDALRAHWGVGADDDLVVACVGRLAPEKNLRRC